MLVTEWNVIEVDMWISFPFVHTKQFLSNRFGSLTTFYHFVTLTKLVFATKSQWHKRWHYIVFCTKFRAIDLTIWFQIQTIKGLVHWVQMGHMYRIELTSKPRSSHLIISTVNCSSVTYGSVDNVLTRWTWVNHVKKFTCFWKLTLCDCHILTLISIWIGFTY